MRILSSNVSTARSVLWHHEFLLVMYILFFLNLGARPFSRLHYLHFSIVSFSTIQKKNNDVKMFSFARKRDILSELKDQNPPDSLLIRFICGGLAFFSGNLFLDNCFYSFYYALKVLLYLVHIFHWSLVLLPTVYITAGIC